MNIFKKVIPFIIVALVVGVGVYFITKSSLDDQGASIYGVSQIKAKMSGSAKDASRATPSPAVYAGITAKQCVSAGGTIVERDGLYWCEVIRALTDLPTSATAR